MKLIRLDRLAEAKGIDLSSMQIRRLVAAGRFPKPIQLQPRGSWFFDEGAIDAHLESLAFPTKS